MIVYTTTEIAARFHVTEAQIDKASRVLDCQSGKVFYQVESQTVAGQVYEVRYNEQYKRLTCSCKAGQVGIPCWHKRAAMAAAFEYRQQENVQARKEAEEARLAEYRKLEKARDEARDLVAGLNPGKGVRQATPFTLLA